MARLDLANLRMHDCWIWAYCRNYARCAHHAPVALAPFIIRWGFRASSDLLRRRLRCSRCGHLGADLRLSSVNVDLMGIQGTWPPWRHYRPVDLETIEASFPWMCNLYSLNKKRDEVARHFRVSGNRAMVFEPLAAIFPGHTAPVIRLAEDGERELVTMSWGFVYPQPGKAPRRVTNVRDDKILTSRFWRPSFECRRCLVPASSYCEPDAKTPAGWHWFAVNGAGEAGPGDRHLFAFPGIWQRWHGPIKKDGPAVDIETFSFMTTLPNALTASINHERMPVLLTNEAEFETWLKARVPEALKLARSYDPSDMRIVQSGAEKKDLMGAASLGQAERVSLDLFGE